MTEDEILELAVELDCVPPATALQFALVIACRCADLVEESNSNADASEVIRQAFALD